MQARLRIAVLLTAVLLLVMLGIGTLLLLDRTEAQERAAGRASVERIVRVAEATINRSFVQVDSVLAGLPSLLTQVAGAGPLAANTATMLLRELDEQNFGFRDLVLLQPDGQPWASAMSSSRQRLLPIPVAALVAATRQDTVAILGPANNPTTGEWALFFARGVTIAGAGRMLAVAEVPVPMLVTLLSPVAEAPGMSLLLERSDGQLLASLPHDETRIGQKLPWPAGTPPANGLALETIGRSQQGPVIAARRPTLYQDVQVAAVLDIAASTGPLSRERTRIIAVASSTAVLLLLLALTLDAALNQREKVEAERLRASALLQNALESMDDGFVMWDTQDRLVTSNQRYREIYAQTGTAIHPGASFEDIIRAGLERGQYPQASADHEAFIADLMAWHRGNHTPLERLLPDGRWILVTERRTPDGGVVGIRTDITELKHANRELALANAAAAAATEAKSRFLARMSHELRTPLNGVLGLAQALAQDSTLSAAHRQQAATLEMAGRHLLAVANDVLDLARVESGLLDLHPEPVDLAELLRGCVTMIRPAADTKGVTVTTTLAANLPLGVAVDPTRLRQLALNLLNNAVKFTPEGGRVILSAEAQTARADGQVSLRIAVADTGPGVPAEARQDIFGDFVQLERGGVLGGAGLGLAISRHIALGMGGRIGCDANPDAPSGAVFWLELSLPHATLPRPVAATPAAAAGHGLRLLVADDIAANQAVARALLEAAGHEVDCVADGAQAVAAVQRAWREGQRYDAVLMDVMMPGMDGLEATRRIRALPGPEAEIPILAVTASAFAADIAACHDAGMDGHIAKPIEREKLLAILARVPAATAPARTPLG